MATTATQLLHVARRNTPAHARYTPHARTIAALSLPRCCLQVAKPCVSSKRKITSVGRRAATRNGMSSDADDGVLLGTLKLPANTDLDRFETLLFQWANSLCQGANVPLPVPLKVEKVKGGARLGFSRINGDGTTDMPVYIDCLVFPADDIDSPGGPMFRAIRNGPLSAKAPPGEPRIMRSLLQALQKSVEIASV